MGLNPSWPLGVCVVTSAGLNSQLQIILQSKHWATKSRMVLHFATNSNGAKTL
jgi:hypothetical protein